MFSLTLFLRGDYRKALLDCRRHRIDLNILYDHEPRGFMSRLWSFVDQIEEVDYINLFLTDIGYVAILSGGTWGTNSIFPQQISPSCKTDCRNL